MASPLLEYFGSIRTSDVHQYRPFRLGGDHELFDFPLAGWRESPVDAVITNPPFRLASEFIETALKVSRRAVAMLVRSAFLEGTERFRSIWSRNPPSHVLQFTERVVMLDGRLVRRGALDRLAEKAGSTASSATAYCWLVWIVGDTAETRLRWLAPCMQRLERPGDYPEYESSAELSSAPLLESAA